jgi:hypothetical protein
MKNATKSKNEIIGKLKDEPHRISQRISTDYARSIAVEIIAISNSMKAMSSSCLKRDAIVVLIQDRTKLPKSTIEIVLNNLEQLGDIWIKKSEVMK